MFSNSNSFESTMRNSEELSVENTLRVKKKNDVALYEAFFRRCYIPEANFEKNMASRRNIYTFPDFQKVYDSIPVDKLW